VARSGEPPEILGCRDRSLLCIFNDDRLDGRIFNDKKAGDRFPMN